jgi:peptidoglycan-associated lipoprotein
MKKIVVVLATLLIAACASTPKQAPQTVANSAPSQPVATTAALSSAEVASQKLAAEIQGLEKQSVYFDLDKSAIKTEYQDVLQKQADFITSHQNDIVTVQGNCDERGSPEFNLALGQKRANSAKKSLELLGVPATQIKTVSFGLEKPRLT